MQAAMVKYPWASKSGQLPLSPGLNAQEKEPPKDLVRRALQEGCWTLDVDFGRGSIHFHHLPNRERARRINMPTSFSSHPPPPKLLLVPSTGTSREARETVHAAHTGEPQKQRWVRKVEGRHGGMEVRHPVQRLKWSVPIQLIQCTLPLPTALGGHTRCFLPPPLVHYPSSLA